MASFLFRGIVGESGEMVLEDKVRAAVAKYAMFGSGDTVVVGVSGGPDSVALLHCLTRLSLDITLHVAHLNHRLRGASSDEDAEFVRDLAMKWGLRYTIGARDVGLLAQERGEGVEEAARAARFEFFAEVMAEAGTDSVALAHTADDQAETVLLHLLRGTGMAGLRGMLPVSIWRLAGEGDDTEDMPIVRPMLDVSRDEVLDYCREHGLASREDETNLNPTFLRNRIRHHLIPYLGGYNPRAREVLARTARLLAEDYDLVQEMVGHIWPNIAFQEEGGIVFDLILWKEAPPSLQRHLLREAVRRLAGDVADFAAVHFQAAIESLATKPVGTSLDWPHNLQVVKGYDEFRVKVRREAVEMPKVEPEALNVPGKTRFLGWEITAQVQDARCAHDETNPWHADLDLAAAGGGLVVRQRQQGDRMQPLGMTGHKKVQDILVDAKMPRDDRDRVPIVASPEGIVWLVGCCLDDRAKVGTNTEKVLCLRAERMAGRV